MSDIENDLSRRADGGPAMPVPMGTQHNQYCCSTGMSLRDWFAGQALVGMNASLAGDISWPTAAAESQMASRAYLQADSMLRIRSNELVNIDHSGAAIEALRKRFSSGSFADAESRDEWREALAELGFTRISMYYEEWCKRNPL